jgi:prepilin peptidase CpaA
MNPAFAVALVVSLIACAWDLRTRRIPNALTMGAAVTALMYHLFAGGVGPVGMSVLGLAVGLVIFFPFFVLGGMGAGDVKLLAALGAWLGPVGVFWVAIYAAFAGGVLAIVLALTHRYLNEALVNLYFLFGHWRAAGLRPMPALTLASARGPRLAYALPIAIGTMVTLWLA